MSIRYSIIPAGAATDTSLKGRDLAVLCLLGRHTRKHGWCFRSQVKMAKELSCARSTVQASLTRLVDAGWVQHRRRVHESGAEASHEYRVLLDQDGPVDPLSAGDQDLDPLDVVGDGPMDGADTPADVPAPPCRHTGTTADPASAPPADSGSAPIRTFIDKRSLERERAGARVPQGGEGDQPDGSTSGDTQDVGLLKAEAQERFKKRFWPKWPGRAFDNRDRALAEFLQLSPEEQDNAIAGIGPFHEAQRRAKRTKPLAAATYLKQRKWEDLEGQSIAGGKYQPPFAKPWSPLFVVNLIELLRTGQGRAASFSMKMAADGSGSSLRFGQTRDSELVGAVESFERVPAHGPRWKAWRTWFDGQFAAQHIGARVPHFRDDPGNPFWLSVPSAAMAKAWGIELSLPPAEPHPPPQPISDEEAAIAFE